MRSIALILLAAAPAALAIPNRLSADWNLRGGDEGSWSLMSTRGGGPPPFVRDHAALARRLAAQPATGVGHAPSAEALTAAAEIGVEVEKREAAQPAWGVGHPPTDEAVEAAVNIGVAVKREAAQPASGVGHPASDEALAAHEGLEA